MHTPGGSSCSASSGQSFVPYICVLALVHVGVCSLVRAYVDVLGDVNIDKDGSINSVKFEYFLEIVIAVPRRSGSDGAFLVAG